MIANQLCLLLSLLGASVAALCFLRRDNTNGLGLAAVALGNLYLLAIL